jgi:catechol 2,3-dioxygenase-like lactoylglutathione lyase family enzyme
MTDQRPEFLGIHHVLVTVPPDQKEAAQRFYEDVFGFVPLSSPLESSPSGNLWWYECGNAEFHIALLADFQAHVRPHAAISIRDLPAFRERLERHGIAPKLDYSYKGHWRIYVVDPWNNRLEFISQLPPGIRPGMSDDEITGVLAGGTGASTP